MAQKLVGMTFLNGCTMTLSFGCDIFYFFIYKFIAVCYYKNIKNKVTIMTLTPEQFNKLSTKEYLEKYATRDEMVEFKDEVLTAVDMVVKKLDDIEHAFVSNLAAHDRFEKRISRIEENLKLEPMFG